LDTIQGIQNPTAIDCAEKYKLMMTFKPHGQHLISGQWVAGKNTFKSSPTTGPSFEFSVAGVEEINAAVQAAEDAFWSYGYVSCEKRAAFLNTIADEIEVRAAVITQIGCEETGLPEARLNGERGRTRANCVCLLIIFFKVTTLTAAMMQLCPIVNRCPALS